MSKRKTYKTGILLRFSLVRNMTLEEKLYRKWRMDYTRAPHAILCDEYGKKKHQTSVPGKTNTTVFELVQLVGITNSYNSCMGSLDSYIKGFLLVIFWVDLGGVGRTLGPNRKFPHVFGFTKVKNFELLQLLASMSHVCQVGIKMTARVS